MVTLSKLIELITKGNHKDDELKPKVQILEGGGGRVF
jgi:hypothetical protein